MILVSTFGAAISVFTQSAQADTPFTGGIPAGILMIPGPVYYGCHAYVDINGTRYPTEGIRRDPSVAVNKQGKNPQISDIIIATNQTIRDAAIAFCDASKWASILAKLQVHVDRHAKDCVLVTRRHFVRNGGNGHDHHQPSVKVCPTAVVKYPCELKFNGTVVKSIQVPDLATCKQQVVQ